MKTGINIEDFGKTLREVRRKKGLTQIQLAEKSGISRRMVGHYETVVRRPAIDKIKILATALNVSIDELMGMQKFSSSKNKKENGMTYKIMKKVKIIEELPLRDQNTIFNLINALAEKNKLKHKEKMKDKDE